MLTKRRKEVLDFMKSYLKKNGYSPSLQEIQKKLKLASVSTAHFHVSKLKDEGYITKQSGKARGTEIMVKVPIIGTLIARQPTEADKKNPRAYFALKVKDNNMYKYGIFDGDIVIAKFKE